MVCMKIAFSWYPPFPDQPVPSVWPKPTSGTRTESSEGTFFAWVGDNDWAMTGSTVVGTTHTVILLSYIYMYPHVFITIHKRIYCIYNNDMAVYVYNTWWNICGRLWMHIEYVRCTERWVYHGPSVSPLTCNRGGVDTRGHDKTGITCGIRVGRVSLESLKDCPNFNIWGWFMGKYDSEKVDCSTENGNWPRGNPVFLASTNLRRSNLVHVVESCPLPPISGLHSWLWVMALEPWWTPK